MKKMQALLLSLFLLSTALIVAQTSHPTTAAVGSNAQPLKRYDPQMRSVEKKVGEDTLSISVEKAISPASEQALVGYLTQHYKSRLLALEIHKLPGAENHYAVTGSFDKAQQAQDSSNAPTILLVLRADGNTVSEVSKAENENGSAYGGLSPVFFLGQDKLLIIVSLSSVDGDARLDLVYEYADNNFKPLGQLDVIEKVGMNGTLWRIDSPAKRATAEYKNNAYHVTLRGLKGGLYGGESDAKGNPKKLASAGSPVTFVYDGGTWRLVAKR